ncbi:hybrid-cluster NAD(P)-dependent oxidoreductase [Thalassococcus sp. S3]|uniref:hybrid-cluster NAD(P)-dependent oxidoreductase n=1 Tax=Thalassococcus sp. S3 TaxID=2017482 RepID=UPI001024049C|nr:hybrid-cluster NAD(P)-dependent oxidoreductase [Thalassococcus sp. S3]QBF33976.1 hypothetical protein CFI11_22610 [Thalassococcus sp. S3]
MTTTLSQLQAHDASNGLANIMFSIFVAIADSENDIQPQEVRRFQALLKDPSWTDNEDALDALHIMRADYASIWAAYEAGSLKVDFDTLSASLADLDAGLGETRAASFKRSLNRFLQQLELGGSYPALKFNMGEQKGRAKARAQVESLLSDETADEAASVPTSEPRERPAHPPAQALARTGNRALSSTRCIWPATRLAPQGDHLWQGVRTRVRCVGVRQETHDCKTYTFLAEPLVLFDFKPGQFVTLELPIDGRLLRRSYTISSSPSRPYSLSITVKCVEKGWVSNWLFSNMQVGTELDILGPSGGFTCVDHPADRLLFLSGGSGITPMMSMLRWLNDTSTDADVVFMNSVRTPQDVIFHQELLHLSAEMGERLQLAIVPSIVPNGLAWNGLHGRIDEAQLRSFAPDFLEREVFVCGPNGYMDAVRQMLDGLGFPMERYHDESFGGSVSKIPPQALAPQQRPNSLPADPKESQPIRLPVATVETTKEKPRAGAAEVTLDDTDDVFLVQPGQTILEAAEQNGITLDSACRSGACGTCKMRVLSGQVDMEDTGALSVEEVSEGYVLTCLGTAEGKVTLTT